MNTKIMFSKIASVMTIFMMVFSMVAPMNARAQEETTTEPIVEETSVLGCMDSSALNFNTDATEDDGSCEYEKKEENTSELRVAIEKIDICHQAGDEWNFMQTPAGESLDGHLGHGDFLYEGGAIEDKDAWCQQNGEEIVTPTATISATKILCPSEDLLPNWGAGEADITSTTASDFLAQNPSCEEVDWNFEWSIGAPYVNDNILSGGEGWTSFSNGTTSVPAGENIGLREQMPEGYIPFTGQNTTENVSAEFYCGSDVYNYDNLEYVNTESDSTYHCVAFNVLEPVFGCTDESATNYDPEATQDDESCEYEDMICEEGDETYESVYVSDPTTLVGENPSAVLSFIHDAWTAAIPDASWIWSTNPVALVASVDEVETFTKTFEVTGTPTSASLAIAADNSYSVDLNGEFLCSDESDTNFNLGGQDICIIDLSDLIDGTNTLEFTVTNKEIADNLNPKINPAGLMYKLTVNGDCATCEMEEGWAVDYYNYLISDTGMGLPAGPAWSTSYGDPLGDVATWTGWSYGMDKYKFSQVETDLMFGANFFPFDSGAGLPFKNESSAGGANSGKDFHFGLHAKGYVTAPSAGAYAFTLSSDDDAWIYVNGELVAQNPGVHPVSTINSTMNLSLGVNEVDIFYADRLKVQAQLDFKFLDETLEIMTTEDCLPPPPEMCMDENANNYNQEGECTYTYCEWNQEILASDEDCVPPGELKICGVVLTPSIPTGEQTNPLTYDYTVDVSTNPTAGNFIDHKWIQTFTAEEYRVVWDMGAGTNVAYLIPSIDHGPVPAEAKEAKLYGSNTPTGPWTLGVETTTYPNGPSTWISDDYTTKWTFDMPYRYISALAGGTLLDDGDAEIDAVCSEFTEAPTEVDMCEWNPEISADSDDCYPPMVYDLCLNLPGTQTEVPNGFNQTEGYMCYSQYECSDGIDNSDSEDELSDANDPACHTDGNATDEDEVNSYDPYDTSESNTTEETSNNSSGSRSSSRGSGSRPSGQVLGASTDICDWNASFMRRGWKGNKVEDVKKVQKDVANGLMQAGLVVDGVYGPKTEAAIKAFQAKYASEILDPWNIKAPTGNFYLTSLRHAQKLLCPTIADKIAPIPTLINWNQNPALR